MTKSQVTHTEGPWETGSTMTRVEVWPKGWNVPVCIADCHSKNAPENEEVRIANARLIAAAPELLAACKAILSQSDVYNTPMLDSIRKKIESAIAKAEEV